MSEALFRFYRLFISPILQTISLVVIGPNAGCRFEPTCSRYGSLAYRRHGIIFGTYLTIKRVLRCNPLFKGGLDPVPDKII